MKNIDLARISALQQVNSQRLVDGIAEQNRRNNAAIDSTNYLAEFPGASLASEFAQHILLRVRNIDSQLDESQEVVVNLVDCGINTFSVSGVYPINPSLIIFTGCTEDGKQEERWQHVSRINCALIVRPKLNLEQPKRKIGFIKEVN